MSYVNEFPERKTPQYVVEALERIFWIYCVDEYVGVDSKVLASSIVDLLVRKGKMVLGIGTQVVYNPKNDSEQGQFGVITGVGDAEGTFFCRFLHKNGTFRSAGVSVEAACLEAKRSLPQNVVDLWLLENHYLSKGDYALRQMGFFND